MIRYRNSNEVIEKIINGLEGIGIASLLVTSGLNLATGAQNPALYKAWEYSLGLLILTGVSSLVYHSYRYFKNK